MAEARSRTLLTTCSVAVRDIDCDGACRHPSAEECVSDTHLVFPYRGVFVRHLGADQAVGEANQVLCFNAHEAYRVSHPVPGGDACLDIVVGESLLRELAPASLLRHDASLAFARQRLRIDPRAQLLVARLRHGLQSPVTDALEAEGLALTLVQRALGPRTAHAPSASAGRRRLVDRTKLLFSSDPARRWTLADVAAQVGGSPVYLTQVFQQVEGIPLYRYQRRLRLARALDLLPGCDDLTALALDLGFSSHSHFSAAFRETYGRTPSAVRSSILRRSTAGTH